MASNGTKRLLGFGRAPALPGIARSTASDGRMRLRLAFFGSALLLAAQALWMTLPELFLPQRLHTFSDPAGTEVLTRQRAAAERAARLAGVRGELWAELALTYTGLVWDPERKVIIQSTPLQDLERARALAETALRRSPHDSRVWLLCAALALRIEELTGHRSDRPAAGLKMSYFTGQYELGLAPLRLALAVRPSMLSDEELRHLVRAELSAIVTSEPELKPAIVAAYREATPTAKSLIEDVVAGQDPELLKSVQSSAGVQGAPITGPPR